MTVIKTQDYTAAPLLWGLMHIPYSLASHLLQFSRLNTATGGLVNEQKTYLLQQETCNQIEWVVVNNKAYLGIWGFDSLSKRLLSQHVYIKY